MVDDQQADDIRRELAQIERGLLIEHMRGPISVKWERALIGYVHALLADREDRIRGYPERPG
jgi:hypothetical protein